MFKLCCFIGSCFALLYLTDLKASEKFPHPFETLNNTPASLLDLRINKLDLLLHIPNNLVTQPNISTAARHIFIGMAAYPYYWGHIECQFDAKKQKIIFTAHLGSKLSDQLFYFKAALQYQGIDTSSPIAIKKNYAKELFDSLVIMTQRHIHSDLTEQDVILLVKGFRDGDWSVNKTSDEVLIFIWKNGVPHYKEPFFEY
jgi:hypothetical protein